MDDGESSVAPRYPKAWKPVMTTNENKERKEKQVFAPFPLLPTILLVGSGLILITTGVFVYKRG